MHVVLVTSEVWPLVEGGGIARYVAESAKALAADGARVTVLTSSRFAERHAELIAAGDPRAGAQGVEWGWVPEPDGDLTPLWSHHHAWSMACWDAVRDLCEREEVNVVEFEDYGGAATVTLDAARTRHPALRGVALAVRLHSTWEMTQVLDGLRHDDVAGRTVMALERHSLAFADRLLAPSEPTLAAYRAFYGEELAPAVIAPMPSLDAPVAANAATPPDPDGPLKLLFVGRLQRLKGVEELVRAALAIPSGDWSLTLAGGDTETAPDGGSMREHLERLAAGEPRVEFAGKVDRDRLTSLMREHHVVVVPSYFEAYGYVVREAAAQNRAVLGAGGGGIADALEADGAGWLVPARDEPALTQAIERLIADRESIDAAIREQAPRRAAERPLAAGEFSAPYAALAAPGARPAEPAGPPGPLTSVITVGHGERGLDRTLDSLEDAGGGEIEIIVSAAGPELVPSAVLGRVHRLVLPEHDEPAALRRAGLALAGRDGLRLLLRAGDSVTPSFLRRGVEAMRANHDLAYVTAHAPGRRPACAPLGNFAARFIPELGVAGTVALVRADAADAISDGQSPPPIGLADGRRFGAVISERLTVLGRAPSPEPDGASPLPPVPGDDRLAALLSSPGTASGG